MHLLLRCPKPTPQANAGQRSVHAHILLNKNQHLIEISETKILFRLFRLYL